MAKLLLQKQSHLCVNLIFFLFSYILRTARGFEKKKKTKKHDYYNGCSYNIICQFTIWLVGCFGFDGPCRQYFSLYRAVSQREGERGEKG